MPVTGVQTCALPIYNDYLFDEIGSELKIRRYQREKRELLESLELYYRVIFLGEEVRESDEKEEI